MLSRYYVDQEFYDNHPLVVIYWVGNIINYCLHSNRWYLLRRRSSIFFARLAALLARSSFSCSALHRWKFSTTTPTNIFSTKNPTRSKNDMKYINLHSLKFCFGCNMWIRKINSIFTNDPLMNVLSLIYFG